MSKYCPHCHCSMVIRFGVQNGRQRYRCKQCKKVWQNRPQSQRLEAVLQNDYFVGDLKISQLCKKYQLGDDKVREILYKYKSLPIIPSCRSHNVFCMDSTYFGRRGINEWGLLIIIDAHTGECLYAEEISGHETYAHYIAALGFLRNNYGIIPKACVIDGVTGLAEVLARQGILVQYCQFHQIKTVIGYLTRSPILEPNRELKQIAKALTKVKRDTFKVMFNSWFYRYRIWLKERSRNPDTGKLEFTHKKTRSAVHSLQRNFPYLYTFEQHPELQIPNTNNMLEGINSAIKHKLNHHRGANKALKTQLIRVFLSRRTGV